MSKRSNFSIASLKATQERTQQVVAATTGGGGGNSGHVNNNPFLAHPVQPERALQMFLTQVRNAARNYLPKESQRFPISTAFCEVEARLGILKVLHAIPERRVTSSGAKHVQGQSVKAFDCSQTKCAMESGTSRTHFIRWTGSGISEMSPISQALGVSDAAALKRDLIETETIETVYLGYANNSRLCYPGLHDAAQMHASSPMIGKMESKEKLMGMDLTLPAAPYDMRISLSSEKTLNANVGHQPPPGWSSQRIKRRRSYTRRDKSIAWQIDVTEVTTNPNPQQAQEQPQHGSSGTHGTVTKTHVDYEVELELRDQVLLQIINEDDPEKLKKMTAQLAQQLWWILSQINPLKDAVDVEECLQDHPDKRAVQLALAQCGAMKRYVDSRGHGTYESPIAKPTETPSAVLSNVNFVGCMPVNFSRHNLEEIQRGADNAYFLSEKTDGVRHLLIFTGDTAVLVDRAMRGKQPVPIIMTSADNDSNNGEGGSGKRGGGPTAATPDPFASILDLFKPGTVLDGEVVMNRRGKKPRPIFIVFDVMAISATEPVLHLPFEHRLKHLRQASFRTRTAARDMFDPNLVADPRVALPLVRKNFVKRIDLDDLLQHVIEERGMRIYRNGDCYNHLTDGIIFQPNLPYVCGTDVKLLKWKYLDTVTIDIELLPLRHNDDDDTLRVGCLGEEQTRVDMTRHVHLPKSERMRLEADRMASGGKIAEVGFDPETGEWYYLTMRSDKIAPNHIGTVLGTLLELGECLTTDELRYRMSVLPGSRDTYRKDMRGMLKQLMEHQRRKLKGPQRSPGPGGH